MGRHGDFWDSLMLASTADPYDASIFAADDRSDDERALVHWRMFAHAARRWYAGERAAAEWIDIGGEA